MSRTQAILIEIFEARFSDMQTKLKDAKLIIQGQPSAMPQPSTDTAEDAIEIDELLDFRKGFHTIMKAGMSAREKAASGAISPIMLPFLFIKDLFGMLFRSPAKSVLQRQEREMQRFRKKPESFMQDVFLQAVEFIKASDNLEDFIRNKLEGVSRKIAEIESIVPMALQDEADLLGSLRRDTRGTDTIRSPVKPIIDFLSVQVKILAEFGNKYTYTADYDEEDIEGLKDGMTGRWKALWGCYTFGRLKDGTNVCVKTNTDRGHLSVADELEILRLVKSA